MALVIAAFVVTIPLAGRRRLRRRYNVRPMRSSGRALVAGLGGGDGGVMGRVAFEGVALAAVYAAGNLAGHGDAV